MTTHKLYQIRKNHGTSMTQKLRSYNRARKLAGYIRSRYGIDAYVAAWKVAA